MLKIGVLKETAEGETRVAITPDVVKKYIKMGAEIMVEASAGQAAGFSDESFSASGANIVANLPKAECDILLSVRRLPLEALSALKPAGFLVGQFEPFRDDEYLSQLRAKKTLAFSLEKLPRTSRAQAMDVLSSQANIAGYRAVIEAALAYKRFVPMMMTSAGMAKAARGLVLGAGVAGLQAIATLRRLGAQVTAFDVRPETKEQIESLGAKFLAMDLGESGVGQGGYAKELSAEAKAKQVQLLSEACGTMDIIISTANIPGRKAPVLIDEAAVKKMREGSVIVDMAAANGGNCPLSEPDRVVVKHGVTIIGDTNLASRVPADASFFYANNLYQFLSAALITADKKWIHTINWADDLVAPCVVAGDAPETPMSASA